MNVLIVDDTPGWLEFHKNILKTLIKDVNITVAHCAKEAYDILLRKVPFDLVITDLQMETDFEPLTAGEWLVKQIKTLDFYKNTKILIISAMYNIKMIAENQNVDFIRKNTLISDKLSMRLKLEEIFPNNDN